MSQLVLNEDILMQVPGFTSQFTEVNGTKLHYVSGGTGMPLILLPGWPQTWWAYHKIMPLLVDKYHVIVVDIRGMGSSSAPDGGYDKKNMAKDIKQLLDVLGYKEAAIAGHDIGANVAFAFAANYPEYVSHLIMLDTPHPDENMYKLPMLPVGMPVYPWWVAFNQVKELPEALLQGRYRLMLDWVFDNLLTDNKNISGFDRDIYEAHYNKADNIRASNAWYQAFSQDIEDCRTYGRLNMPILAMGNKSGCIMLKHFLSSFSDAFSVEEIDNSGHFIMEENPQSVAAGIKAFLK